MTLDERTRRVVQPVCLLFSPFAATLALRARLPLHVSGAVRARRVAAHARGRRSLRIAWLALMWRIHLADFQLSFLDHVRDSRTRHARRCHRHGLCTPGAAWLELPIARSASKIKIRTASSGARMSYPTSRTSIGPARTTRWTKTASTTLKAAGGFQKRAPAAAPSTRATSA